METIKVNQSNSDVKYLVNYAGIRLNSGARYGDDMKSSAILCYEDAIKLLTDAKKIIETEISRELNL